MLILTLHMTADSSEPSLVAGVRQSQLSPRIGWSLWHTRHRTWKHHYRHRVRGLKPLWTATLVFVVWDAVHRSGAASAAVNLARLAHY